MDVKNAGTPRIILEDNNKSIRMVVYEIGAWNMDTTPSVQFAYTINPSKVVSVDCMIIIDGQDTIHNLISTEDFDTVNGIIDLEIGFIALGRRAGGQFDNAEYSSIVVNRGFVTIQYYI